MTSRRQDWFEGWRLFAVLTLTMTALCIWIADMRQFEVEGVRMVIRFTARTLVVVFSALPSAPRRWRGFGPMRWTRWQRRNRRYTLGVTFAASHAIHAVAIGCFAAMAPADYMAATNAASYIFGGHRLRLHHRNDRDLVRNRKRSRDRPARLAHAAISPAAIICGFQFMVSFGKRVPRHAALRAVPDPAVGRDGRCG